MAFLSRIGIIDAQGFREKQSYALLGICVMSALLTPADPGSMLLMAIPLFVLYQLGIFFRIPCRKGGRSIMANEPLQQQLALLYQLQERDQELLSIQRKLQEIPRSIKQLESDVIESEEEMAAKSAELAETEKEQRSKKR